MSMLHFDNQTGLKTKVFLLVSGEEKPEYALRYKADFAHFVFSRLVGEKPEIRVFETKVMSLDLRNGTIFGPYDLGRHNVGPDWDLTDFIHTHVYAMKILKQVKLLTDKEVDCEYLNRDKTRFAMAEDHLEKFIHISFPRPL